MLPAGVVLGERYRIERPLGRGGMADVYLASDLRLPKQCAVKVLRTNTADQQLRYRFQREADILASLHHAHIVDVSDLGVTAEDQPYLVMELLEGEDLSLFMQRTGPLRLPVALNICMQIGDALLTAHKLGVVHRDLKPANIFLCKRGPFPNFVKVLDFGIAKLSRPDTTTVTGTATIMGTPGYMAPEQAVGAQDKVDHRADQFALAAILYEMLAGHPPFHSYGQPMGVILEQALYNEPVPLPMPHINAAVMRALAKKPENRFPDIQSFLDNVGATNRTIYNESRPAGLSRSDSPPPVELMSKKTGVRWLLPAAGIFAIVVAGAAGLVYKTKSAVPAPALDSPRGGGIVDEPADIARGGNATVANSDSEQFKQSQTRPSAPVAQPTEAGERLRTSRVDEPDLALSVANTTPRAAGRPARPAAGVAVSRAFRVTAAFDNGNLHMSGEREQMIRSCSEKFLRPVSNLAPGAIITLVRVSNQLLPQGPLEVEFDEAGFLFCVAHSFQRGDVLPTSVKITVVRGN